MKRRLAELDFDTLDVVNKLVEDYSKYQLRCWSVARDKWYEVNIIKDAIANDEPEIVLANWNDLSVEDQEALWVAPKFGGVFTTIERKYLQDMPKNG